MFAPIMAPIIFMFKFHHFPLQVIWFLHNQIGLISSSQSQFIMFFSNKIEAGICDQELVIHLFNNILFLCNEFFAFLDLRLKAIDVFF